MRDYKSLEVISCNNAVIEGVEIGPPCPAHMLS
jgi:hypothetical protein